MANRRAGPRFPAKQAAEVRNITSPAVILDVSEHGLRLRLPWSVSVGSQLEVLWDRGVATGEVRYCRRVAPALFNVGLRIEHLVEKSLPEDETGAA